MRNHPSVFLQGALDRVVVNISGWHKLDTGFLEFPGDVTLGIIDAHGDGFGLSSVVGDAALEGVAWFSYANFATAVGFDGELKLFLDALLNGLFQFGQHEQALGAPAQFVFVGGTGGCGGLGVDGDREFLSLCRCLTGEGAAGVDIHRQRTTDRLHRNARFFDQVAA